MDNLKIWVDIAQLLTGIAGVVGLGISLHVFFKQRWDDARNNAPAIVMKYNDLTGKVFDFEYKNTGDGVALNIQKLEISLKGNNLTINQSNAPCFLGKDEVHKFSITMKEAIPFSISIKLRYTDKTKNIRCVTHFSVRYSNTALECKDQYIEYDNISTLKKIMDSFDRKPLSTLFRHILTPIVKCCKEIFKAFQ